VGYLAGVFRVYYRQAADARTGGVQTRWAVNKTFSRGELFNKAEPESRFGFFFSGYKYHRSDPVLLASTITTTACSKSSKGLLEHSIMMDALV